jgi:lipopolysaccharide/colanic/teichoic acid biosynthesis glycosyltransferase
VYEAGGDNPGARAGRAVEPPISVLDVSALGAAGPAVRELAALPRPAASIAKRGLDILLSVLGLILAAPVMLVVALVIYIADGGAPIFAQTRYGRGGRVFRFYKFRSMASDADQRLQGLLDEDAEAAQEWHEQRKLREDPRITAFGRFIRKWSIDELPQLFNVLRGDMSMVGPRPLVKSGAEMLDDRALYGADFRIYVRARPGITGLWQVSGRADTAFSERVAYDVDYVRNWSLARDAWIMLKTIPAVLLRRGAH